MISHDDIRCFRLDTPGTARHIHFNNAGSSLPPEPVVDAIVRYLKEEADIGGYEAEALYSDRLENTYTLIGRLINAAKEEIALVENASIAWGLAFYGLSFSPGDEVITSEFEYVTNIIGFIQAKRDHGIVLKVIPNDARGNFSLDALADALSPRTKLIAVTHVASTAGGVLPVADIGRMARKHEIIYLVDACQSVGQLPVDVQELQCDLLSVTGRKYLRGPRGTGFLYVRKAFQHRLKPIFMDGHSMEWVREDDYKPRDNARRFELYERNRALVLGLGAAVTYALDIGIASIWHRIQALANLLRERLATLPGVTVHDIGDVKCGIVNFSVAGMEASVVKNKLAEKNIHVSVGLARSTLFYMNRLHLDSVVRASVHYFNTEAEIDMFCNTIQTAL